MGCCRSAPAPLAGIVPEDGPEKAAAMARARGEGRRVPPGFSEAMSSTAAPSPAEAARAEAEADLLVRPPRVPRQKSLIKACKDNDIAAVDSLLCSGAALESLGMWDNTPLLVACTYGHKEIALKLIAAKADIEARNENGCTSLHYAAVEGQLEVTHALVEAARGHGGKAALNLVNAGLAKIYNRHLDTYVSRAPLGAAAESGHKEVAETLVRAGAVLEAAGPDSRTPLWLAAKQSRLGVVKLLLDCRAEPYLKDKDGISVLEAATSNCNEEIVRALLASGISDVNATAGSPLRDAVRAKRRGVVEALLTQGANVHPKIGSRAGTVASAPLHEACGQGDEYVISILIRNRADPSIANLTGCSSFDILRKRGLPEVQISALLSPPNVLSGTGGADGSTGASTGGPPDVIAEHGGSSGETIQPADSSGAAMN